jgi:hypothetical protein
MVVMFGTLIGKLLQWPQGSQIKLDPLRLFLADKSTHRRFTWWGESREY